MAWRDTWQDTMNRMLRPKDGVSVHVTSPYGSLREGGSSPHVGTDFNYVGGRLAAVNTGGPTIYSPVGGVVVDTGGGHGQILIKDDNGFFHQILHTKKQLVAAGEPGKPTIVRPGDPIGIMGDVGAVGWPHVHYAVMDHNKIRMNPVDYWNGTIYGDALIPPTLLKDGSRFGPNEIVPQPRPRPEEIGGSTIAPGVPDWIDDHNKLSDQFRIQRKSDSMLLDGEAPPREPAQIGTNGSPEPSLWRVPHAAYDALSRTANDGRAFDADVNNDGNAPPPIVPTSWQASNASPLFGAPSLALLARYYGVLR